MSNSTDSLAFAEPDGIKARGTLIVLPGRGETAEVYRRFGIRMAIDAYRVYVLDDATTNPERVCRQLRTLLGHQEPARPVVLVGSDTGSLFAARLLGEDKTDSISGLILAGLPASASASAPGTWEDELGARTTCPTHRGRISSEILRPGALYEAVPDGWLEGAALDTIEQPVLALHGVEDPISPLEAAQTHYANLSNVELVTIAGAPHDVLNDQTHRSVAASVILWLERLRTGDVLAPIASHRAAGIELA